MARRRGLELFRHSPSLHSLLHPLRAPAPPRPRVLGNSRIGSAIPSYRGNSTGPKPLQPFGLGASCRSLSKGSCVAIRRLRTSSLLLLEVAPSAAEMGPSYNIPLP